MSSYAEFLARKTQYSGDSGFKPSFIPDCMFDFQKYLLDFSCTTGRAAILTDCGTGKTLCELAYAENVARHTNGRTLLMTPNAVSAQTVAEGGKFGIDCVRSKGGAFPSTAKIVVSNYEQLKHFDPNDFAAFIGDEISVLKNPQGVTRNDVTEFTRHMKYRLGGTATPAPNDFFEMGTISEALGYLGHMDMLNRFFKNDQNNSASGRMHGKVIEWRFKGHAQEPFYRYLCSWARAARKPSDLGFDNCFDQDGHIRLFALPPLEEREHMVVSNKLRDGYLFSLPAFWMREQREERRVTIEDRVAIIASLVDGHDCSLIWAQLNAESDLIEKTIPGCVQISGADSDEEKEEKFLAFCSGQIKRLVTKGKIAAYGLNLQHCAHQISFPDHSFEKIYQQIRRSWRFGQTRTVVHDIVMTEGDRAVFNNQKRKAAQAEQMFGEIVRYMHDALRIDGGTKFTEKETLPAWL